LVPASLHTNDAVGAISRMRDLEVPDYLISASLRGVIAQRLLRKLCTVCRQPTEGSRYQAVGCTSCNQTGYRSRLAVGEVLIIDDEVRLLIDQKAGESAIRRSVVARGFKSMRVWAQHLVETGVTDSAELDRVFGGASV
jgi:general secretion pathway protein E